ncbi:hypothetical protein bcgnr5369_36320 [Bacillus cereus]
MRSLYNKVKMESLKIYRESPSYRAFIYLVLLNDNVEIDDTYFLYSEKGRRGISDRKPRK